MRGIKRLKQFAERTVTNGQVKIFGRIYHAYDREVPYDGRFDGQRAVFGLYQLGDDYEQHVYFCGIRNECGTIDLERNVSPNGFVCWMFWLTEKAAEADRLGLPAWVYEPAYGATPEDIARAWAEAKHAASDAEPPAPGEGGAR